MQRDNVCHLLLVSLDEVNDLHIYIEQIDTSSCIQLSRSGKNFIGYQIFFFYLSNKATTLVVHGLRFQL